MSLSSSNCKLGHSETLSEKCGSIWHIGDDEIKVFVSKSLQI
jgi:hypothetical protein